MLKEFVKSYVMFWASFLALAVLVLSGFAPAANADSCRLTTEQFSKMHIQSITLVDEQSGSEVKLRVRVADDGMEKGAGYQHICPEIIAKSAILFVYDRPSNHSFHMSNVHDSLDIAFFSESKEIISIQRMEPYVPDEPNVYYDSEGDAQYALETPAGFFEKNQLNVGSTKLILY